MRLRVLGIVLASGLGAALPASVPVAAQGYPDWDRYEERRWSASPEDPYRRPRRFNVEPDPDTGAATDADAYEPPQTAPRTILRRPPVTQRYRPPQDDTSVDTGDEEPAQPRARRYQDDNREDATAEVDKPEGVDGGPRPYIAPVAPPRVAISGYSPGSIVIDTNGRKLYYVTGPTSAYAYPIGVGRDGFSWTGSEKVSRVADWPDWYPPAEMRERKPELPERMLGGLKNPLGAKAIYLGNTLYRIHGTNDPKSIGKAESSGCFRMLNQHVLHLASLVTVGTPVTVVHALAAPRVAAAAAEPAPKVASKPKPVVKKVVAARPPPVVRRRYSEYDDPYDDRPRYERERYFRRRSYDDRYWRRYGDDRYDQ